MVERSYLPENCCEFFLADRIVLKLAPDSLSPFPRLFAVPNEIDREIFAFLRISSNRHCSPGCRCQCKCQNPTRATSRIENRCVRSRRGCADNAQLRSSSESSRVDQNRSH